MHKSSKRSRYKSTSARGELVIHFSTPADLINRLAETSATLSELDRQADTSRTDGKADRGGRRGNSRLALTGGARSEVDPEGSASDLDQPAHSG